MIKTKLIPLESVLKDTYMLLKDTDISEDLVMEFAVRGMEHMVVYQTYEKAVCILRVENSQVAYPHGMLGIEGVMYKAQMDKQDEQFFATSNLNVAFEYDKVYGELKLTSKCEEYHIVDFRMQRFGNCGWKYLSLSNNSWDRSILCDTSANLHSSCGQWFIPDNTNSRFITSFDKGWIAVAYYRFPMNEAGQFLVPDHPLYNEALDTYVLYKISQRQWHMSVQGAETRYKHYLDKWEELAAAAVGELMMPSLPDYINIDKQNRFFKDDGSTKVFGGGGSERINLR